MMATIGRDLKQIERENKEARERRKAADAERLEQGLRAGFLAVPGATEEDWEAEKSGVMAEHRKRQALSGQEGSAGAQQHLMKSAF